MKHHDHVTVSLIGFFLNLEIPRLGITISLLASWGSACGTSMLSQVNELPLSYPGERFYGNGRRAITKPHLLLLVLLSALGSNSSSSGWVAELLAGKSDRVVSRGGTVVAGDAELMGG